MSGAACHARAGYIAAQYRLGMLDAETARSFALECFDLGMWSYAIDDAIEMNPPVMSELAPVLERVLAEHGVEIPDREDAIYRVLGSVLRDVAAGRVSPRAGIERVVRVCDASVGHDRTARFVGDSHGLAALLGCYYGYDDLEEAPGAVSYEGLYGDAAIDALSTRIVGLAREWVAAWGRSPSAR